MAVFLAPLLTISVGSDGPHCCLENQSENTSNLRLNHHGSMLAYLLHLDGWVYQSPTSPNPQHSGLSLQIHGSLVLQKHLVRNCLLNGNNVREYLAHRFEPLLQKSKEYISPLRPHILNQTWNSPLFLAKCSRKDALF